MQNQNVVQNKITQRAPRRLFFSKAVSPMHSASLDLSRDADVDLPHEVELRYVGVSTATGDGGAVSGLTVRPGSTVDEKGYVRRAHLKMRVPSSRAKELDDFLYLVQADTYCQDTLVEISHVDLFLTGENVYLDSEGRSNTGLQRHLFVLESQEPPVRSSPTEWEYSMTLLRTGTAS